MTSLRGTWFVTGTDGVHRLGWRRDGPRLRALADGYGLDEQQRQAFPALIAAHTRGMYDLLPSASLTGEQPWARLYDEGHGEHWGPAAEYIEAHLERWAAALLVSGSA